MSTVDLTMLDAMSEEEREAFYTALRERRIAEGKPDPKIPRRTSKAGGVVQVVARGNDNARAALAHERTSTRLAETWSDWRDALVDYATANKVEIPPAAEYDSAETHVGAILALLPADLQTRLTESRASARVKMEQAKIKIEQKLKGRNTQAESRAKRASESLASEPTVDTEPEEDIDFE